MATTTTTAAPSAHLTPECAACTSYAGFVRVGSDELKVRVRNVRRVGVRVSLERAQLDVEPRLAAILAAQHDTLKIRLVQSSSLESFVRELEELVAICAPAQQLQQTALPSAAYYMRLMAELDTVGWHRVLTLTDDLRSLELETIDSAQRKHAIRLALAADFPLSEHAPVCYVDAPAPFDLVWEPPLPTATGKCAVLADILSQFDAFIAKYQAFWDVLDDLDATTCVLEPHRPTRATGRRRIALEKHASIQIDVNPTHARAMCELSFFGSDASVAPLRERWSERVFQWDEALLPRENLASILDVAFPSPTHTTVEDFAVECGICYCYRLDVDATTAAAAAGSAKHADSASVVAQTIIPDKLCENAKCNRPFHEKCLFDWLKALPTARQSFNTVFGECPYCRDAISAKFVL